MIELDNQDPRVKQYLALMTHMLASLVDKQLDWNLATVTEAEDIVERVRMDFRNAHGYDFPRLVAFYMPSVEVLLFYRADLEYKVIHDQMVILAQKLYRRNIKPNAVEMAEAMMRAWPQIIKRDAGVDVIQKTARDKHIRHTNGHATTDQ